MTAILVAEDDPAICHLLTEVLKEEFAATVRCERTGSRALHAIETAGFDLAIIDVNMPEMSGYELARHAINRNIPTLLSSGYPESDNRLKDYECPYLPKPYRIVSPICSTRPQRPSRIGRRIFTASRLPLPNWRRLQRA